MKIIKETTNYITVKGENRNLTFWKHGVGLIPIHPNPKLSEDTEYRIAIKKYLKRKHDR